MWKEWEIKHLNVEEKKWLDVHINEEIAQKINELKSQNWHKMEK